MSTPSIIPFGHTEADVRRGLTLIRTADILAELEHLRFLALEFGPVVADPNRAFVEIQIERYSAELQRRERLLARGGDDPLTPRWPDRDDGLRTRIDAVKERWPLDRFCRELLGGTPQPTSHGRSRMACPLPGHDDRTPSFVLYPDGHAWCFGCQRGGDVLKLTGYVFATARFREQLAHLERTA